MRYPFIPAEKAQAAQITQSLDAESAAVTPASTTATAGALKIDVSVDTPTAAQSGNHVVVKVSDPDGDDVSLEYTDSLQSSQTGTEAQIYANGSDKTISGTLAIAAGGAAKAGRYTVEFSTTTTTVEATFALSYDEATTAWDANTFTWSTEPVRNTISLDVNEGLTLLSVTNAFTGDVVDPETYDVYWFASDGTAVDAAAANDGKAGGFPAAGSTGSYTVAVVQGGFANIADGTELATVRATNPTHVQSVNISKAVTQVSSATAFEYNATAADKGLSDTEFVYTGGSLTVGIAVNGKRAESGYTVAWTSVPTGAAMGSLSKGTVEITNAQAGTYTGTVYGDNSDLTGSATISFTVSPLDLSTVTVTADTAIAGADNYGLEDFKVDGKPLSDAEIDLVVTSFTDGSNVTSGPWSGSNMAAAGSYAYTLTAQQGSANVTGSTVVNVSVFGQAIAANQFKYGTVLIQNGFAAFTTSRGEAFNPGSINVEGSYTGFTYTVTRNGVEVADYTQPGTYALTVTKAASDYSRGGSATGTFTVRATDFNPANATVLFALNGKSYSGTADVDYTGKAYTPQVIAKDGNTTLTEGTDYTVEVTDAQGNAVDEILAVADGYKVVVSFVGFDDSYDRTLVVDVNKAGISQARATADFFAVGADGSAAVPSFEASTAAAGEAFASGNVFALSADEISVSYERINNVDELDANEDGKLDADEISNGTPSTTAVRASELDETGWYLADITVLTTAANIKGSVSDVPFQVSAYAGYTDVDANAWYADPIYQAKDLGYMTGIAGTSLFMPEAAITRAQVAQVVANLANEEGASDVTYPTKFSDVPADAWFAFPVYWASQAGIVTGIGDTGTFAPYDNASREQIATMLYRYAKAQGKDVSAYADLSGYADGAAVSDWAAEAVEWAVSEGIMGVGTDELRPQDDLSRAEMAAMAVRMQPEALA